MARIGLPCGLILALAGTTLSTGFDVQHREAFTVAGRLAEVANLALCLGLVGVLTLFIHGRKD